MTVLRRSRTARLLLAASLFALSVGASARDVRMHGPNGEGGSCPDVTEETDAPAPAPKRTQAGTRQKAKSAPMMRSAGDSTTRPRWHSFLPGMFR